MLAVKEDPDAMDSMLHYATIKQESDSDEDGDVEIAGDGSDGESDGSDPESLSSEDELGEDVDDNLDGLSQAGGVQFSEEDVLAIHAELMDHRIESVVEYAELPTQV